MRRRDFLVGSSRAVLGSCLLPTAAPAGGNQQSTESAHGAAWRDLTSDLEREIPKLMEESMVPGLSIVIIKDATIKWRRGFGVKDATSKKLVDNDTAFEAASMSKPVFAYAVMKLCERGVMDLDTPLTRYTAERVLKGDTRLDLITARHVLSHTSGFQNWRTEEEPLKIHFTPGEKHLYSGEGYSYLQSVVTHLTRQPIEPYMKANLFVPFGMACSGYVWNDLFERRMARPHDREGKPFENHKRTAKDVARYAAAGDLHTTPTDYAKFMLEIIAPKESDRFRLKKASLAEMLRPQVKVTENDEYAMLWALGWRVIRTKNGDFINHGGDNEGFHSWAQASVESKAGFVIMTNGENGAQLLTKLAPVVAQGVHLSPDR